MGVLMVTRTPSLIKPLDHVAGRGGHLFGQLLGRHPLPDLEDLGRRGGGGRPRRGPDARARPLPWLDPPPGAQTPRRRRLRARASGAGAVATTGRGGSTAGRGRGLPSPAAAGRGVCGRGPREGGRGRRGSTRGGSGGAGRVPWGPREALPAPASGSRPPARRAGRCRFRRLAAGAGSAGAAASARSAGAADRLGDRHSTAGSDGHVRRGGSPPPARDDRHGRLDRGGVQGDHQRLGLEGRHGGCRRGARALGSALASPSVAGFARGRTLGAAPGVSAPSPAAAVAFDRVLRRAAGFAGAAVPGRMACAGILAIGWDRISRARSSSTVLPNVKASIPPACSRSRTSLVVRRNVVARSYTRTIPTLTSSGFPATAQGKRFSVTLRTSPRACRTPGRLRSGQLRGASRRPASAPGLEARAATRFGAVPAPDRRATDRDRRSVP